LAFLCKRHADVLTRGIQSQQILCVLDILFCQCSTVNFHIRHVDTLTCLQLATLHHLHLQFHVRELLHDLNFHQAVLNQQFNAHFGCFHKGPLLYCGLHGDASRPDMVIVVFANSKFEDVAFNQWDRITLKLCHSELRTLKISKDLNFASQFLGQSADKRVDTLKVAPTAVGAVQAEDVSSCHDHLWEHFLAP